MAATMTHPAVRATPSESCPFCGCGDPLASHVKQRATARRSSSTIKHAPGLPPRFWTDPNYRPMFPPGTPAGHLFFGGQSPRIGDRVLSASGRVADIPEAYQAHVDAGHVFVSDKTGSYWTDKDGRPLIADDGAPESEEAA